MSTAQPTEDPSKRAFPHYDQLREVTGWALTKPSGGIRRSLTYGAFGSGIRSSYTSRRNNYGDITSIVNVSGAVIPGLARQYGVEVEDIDSGSVWTEPGDKSPLMAFTASYANVTIMATLCQHFNGLETSHINRLMTDSFERHPFLICEDGLSYCVAMNATAVSDERHWNLAYTTMWANAGEWVAKYCRMCWDSGQRIKLVNFIEKYYDEANDD